MDTLAEIEDTLASGNRCKAKKTKVRLFRLVYLKVAITLSVGVLVCQTVTTLIINPILQYRLDERGCAGSSARKFSDNYILLVVVGLISLVYYVWLVGFLWSTRRRSFYILFVIVCELVHVAFILVYVIVTFMHKMEQAERADKFKLLEHVTNTLALGVYLLVDLVCVALLVALLVKKMQYVRAIKSQKVLFNADYHLDTMRIFV